MLALLEHLQGKRSKQRLVRTFVRDTESGQVKYMNWADPDVPFADVGTPTWDGLPLTEYLSLLDMLNPMNRLWSDGRWNKLTIAHGCCGRNAVSVTSAWTTLADTKTPRPRSWSDRIEAIVKETGQTGFHFVDEAAPPKALKALAHELIKRKLQISWWGNIRLKSPSHPSCANFVDSGALRFRWKEVASDRLLALMKKAFR